MDGTGWPAVRAGPAVSRDAFEYESNSCRLGETVNLHLGRTATVIAGATGAVVLFAW